MTFLKKTFHKLIFLLLAFFLAGAALFYYFFIGIDAGCAQRPPDAHGACYTADLLDAIPIARIELESSGPDEKGLLTMSLRLTPVGLAAFLSNGNRFELSSAFRADNAAPRDFAISLFDKNGPRYVKASHYDFENKTLRWEKSWPPDRNRKNIVKEYSLTSSSLSPLSAFFLMTRRPADGSGDETMKVQVQDIPYMARKTVEAEEGGVMVSAWAVGKDKGRVEPWKRHMKMGLELIFSCGPAIENTQGCFPDRVALPLNLITMTAAEPDKRVAGR